MSIFIAGCTPLTMSQPLCTSPNSYERFSQMPCSVSVETAENHCHRCASVPETRGRLGTMGTYYHYVWSWVSAAVHVNILIFRICWGSLSDGRNIIQNTRSWCGKLRQSCRQRYCFRQIGPKKLHIFLTPTKGINEMFSRALKNHMKAVANLYKKTSQKHFKCSWRLKGCYEKGRHSDGRGGFHYNRKDSVLDDSGKFHKNALSRNTVGFSVFCSKSCLIHRVCRVPMFWLTSSPLTLHLIFFENEAGLDQNTMFS